MSIRLLVLTLCVLFPVKTYAQFDFSDSAEGAQDGQNGSTSENQSSDDSSVFDFLPSTPGNSSTFDEDEFKFEKSPEEIERELRNEAFNAALDGVLPLRPDEIRRLIERFDRTQESVQTPVYPNPKPEVSVETISMDPGAEPTKIKTSFGYVSTLNVLDSTGAPWPIQDITWAGDFQIDRNSEGEAIHFVRISPQSEYAYGNISMMLVGLQTPIIISLETSRDMVHYRFDAIVPEPGPLARASLIDTGLTLAAGDVNMSGILEGLIPEGAKRMNVSGVDGRTSAYAFNGMTYLRTPLNLLSPGWSASTSSADGMKVYAINTTPVVLLSEKGRVVKAKLSERDRTTDE